jgi:hypothetical protein
MTPLVMMRDVEARFALQGRPVRYTVLRPYGNWFGRGALRVLRVSERISPQRGELVDVVLGYDGYDASA